MVDITEETHAEEGYMCSGGLSGRVNVFNTDRVLKSRERCSETGGRRSYWSLENNLALLVCLSNGIRELLY